MNSVDYGENVTRCPHLTQTSVVVKWIRNDGESAPILFVSALRPVFVCLSNKTIAAHCVLCSKLDPRSINLPGLSGRLPPNYPH